MWSDSGRRKSMKQNIVLQVVKGVVFAYFISAVALVILAFIMYKWDVSDNVVRGGILAAYVLSCFISGTVVSRQHSERRYLWGLLMGAIYFTILWVVSLIGNRGAFTGVTGILPALALCLFGGMLGGMMQAGRK